MLELKVLLELKDKRRGQGKMYDLAQVVFLNSPDAKPLAVGLNCALGAALMCPYIEELSKAAADTFLSCYPNAGLPNPMSETGFDETPAITAGLIEEFAQAGFLNIAGGCCGTTPAHIAEIAKCVRQHLPRETTAA